MGVICYVGSGRATVNIRVTNGPLRVHIGTYGTRTGTHILNCGLTWCSLLGSMLLSAAKLGSNESIGFFSRTTA